MCPSIRPPHPPRLSHSASVGSQHASAPTKKSHNKSRALSKRHLKNTHKKGFEGFLLRMAYAPPIESAARELKHCPNAAESACGSCRRVSLRPWASSSMCRTSSISRPLAGAGDIFRTRRLPRYYPPPLNPPSPLPYDTPTHPPPPGDAPCGRQGAPPQASQPWEHQQCHRVSTLSGIPNP